MVPNRLIALVTGAMNRGAGHSTRRSDDGAGKSSRAPVTVWSCRSGQAIVIVLQLALTVLAEVLPGGCLSRPGRVHAELAKKSGCYPARQMAVQGRAGPLRGESQIAPLRWRHAAALSGPRVCVPGSGWPDWPRPEYGAPGASSRVF